MPCSSLGHHQPIWHLWTIFKRYRLPLSLALSLVSGERAGFQHSPVPSARCPFVLLNLPNPSQQPWLYLGSASELLCDFRQAHPLSKPQSPHLHNGGGGH